MDAVHRPSSALRGERSATLAVVIVFWTFQFASLTAQRFFLQQDDDTRILIPRLMTTTAGVLLSLLVARITSSRAGRPMLGRLALAIALAAGFAAVHGLVNWTVFRLVLGAADGGRNTLVSYSLAYISWFWNYCSISSILLVISYARELGRRERDVAALRGLADSAQLTALRYQLNPHFMFNALNSIVSLIGMGRGEAAETMVEDLSDYYRAMLDMKMGDEVPLSQEVDMQRLYLGIESARFPDRIDVQFDVADDCLDVVVPGLILQPLVENAVKHGVARRDAVTVLRLAARRQGGRVVIEVDNHAPAITAAPPPGAGIGLANVARRLELFYGEDCGFSAGLDSAAGLFRVAFSVPDPGS